MQVRLTTNEKGIIAWFASNHVAANLLMMFIIVAGLISVVTIRKQTTPEIDLNWIQVQVPYLGAAPQEVEEGVVIKVEEAVQGWGCVHGQGRTPDEDAPLPRLYKHSLEEDAVTAVCDFDETAVTTAAIGVTPPMPRRATGVLEAGVPVEAAGKVVG